MNNSRQDDSDFMIIIPALQLLCLPAFESCTWTRQSKDGLLNQPESPKRSGGPASPSRRVKSLPQEVKKQKATKLNEFEALPFSSWPSQKGTRIQEITSTKFRIFVEEDHQTPLPPFAPTLLQIRCVCVWGGGSLCSSYAVVHNPSLY